MTQSIYSTFNKDPPLKLVPLVPELPEVPFIPLVPELPEVPSIPLVPDEPEVPEEPLLEVPLVPLEPEVPDKLTAKVVTILERVESLISIMNEVLFPVVLAKILTLILELTDAKT